MDPCLAQNTWEIFPEGKNKHSLAATVIFTNTPIPITINLPHLFKTKTNTTQESTFARHILQPSNLFYIPKSGLCGQSWWLAITIEVTSAGFLTPESSGWVLFSIPDVFQGDISLCDKWLGGRGGLFLICVSLGNTMVPKSSKKKFTVIWADRKCESSFQIYNCKALDKRQVTNPCLK